MDYIGAMITGTIVLLLWIFGVYLVVSQGWGMLLVIGGVCLGLYCIFAMVFDR